MEISTIITKYMTTLTNKIIRIPILKIKINKKLKVKMFIIKSNKKKIGIKLNLLKMTKTTIK